uniref:Uncharacterized protein n=1 Tax=Knipowitschia caucasica TaxID=637954 RepID=A0AAV2LJ02_KNICA
MEQEEHGGHPSISAITKWRHNNGGLQKDSGTVYVLDPALSNNIKASKKAAAKMTAYLTMRDKTLKTGAWTSKVLKGGAMIHPTQTDGCSRGVIVVMMARAIMADYPNLPVMDFSTSKENMEQERRQMALEILEVSEQTKSFKTSENAGIKRMTFSMVGK